MHENRVSIEEYEKLVSKFNPVNFSAEEWVKITADAGQKYIVVTSRHHDGFSMYDTALSEYKVTNTPFKRDPLYELANACARQGDIQLGFYSSLLDWHHPAYRSRKISGLNWETYVEFLHGQVRELCTNYGPLQCIWFDGEWPRDPYDENRDYFLAGGSFKYDELYNMIHKLQPDAVVINNRHDKPLPGEDVQNFEQDLPGENTNPIVTNLTEISPLPLEVCMTINDSWGINFEDHNNKSAKKMIKTLCQSAAADSNFLLNVGPTAEGEILAIHANRLKQIGDWLMKNGEAIYGSKNGPIIAEGCVSTEKPNATYVISIDYLSDSITLKNIPPNATQASLLDGTKLLSKKNDSNWAVEIPPESRDPFATVIKITHS